MSDYKFLKETSIPLLGGGDTHIDKWNSGTGFTVTTRTPYGFEDHQQFRYKNLESTPPCPDILADFFNKKW
jgi:hypothetical protein